MNRTTLVALAAFAILLGVVLFVKTVPSGAEDASLRVEGWKAKAEAAAKEKESPDGAAGDPAGGAAAPGEDLPVAGAPGMEDLKAPKPPKELFSDIERIEITRKGKTIVLEREGTDGKTWVVREPLRATADWFRVRPILDKFQEPVESSLSKAVQAEDLRLFKLDESHRIRLKLVEGGKVFADLFIGGTEKADTPGAQGGPGGEVIDTWVMAPADAGRAYRVAGVDLRTPVDKEVSDLRSKKVFDRKKETVQRVVVENPDDAVSSRIVLVREGDEGGEGGWRIETPPGYRAGGIDAFVSSALGLYATDFLPPDDAVGSAALAKGAARVTLETADDSIVLLVSVPDDKFGYVQVEGSAEIVKVSQFTAKNLRKTLSDLRGKNLFDFDGGDIVALRLQTEKGEVGVRREGGAWVAEKPAGLAVGAKPMGTLLRDVAGLSVLEWRGTLPPAETGLDAPSRRVVVEANGAVHTLLFGKEVDSRVFGTLEGSPEVFEVSAHSVKKLDRSPDDLKDRSVFGLERDAIARVELHHPRGETVVLERGGGVGADWQLVQEDGPAPAKKGPVASLLASLVNLEAKAVKADTKPADAGLADGAFRVVVATADGATRTLWLGEAGEDGEVPARADTPRWAGQVFTIAAAQAKGFEKTTADLKDDGKEPPMSQIQVH